MDGGEPQRAPDAAAGGAPRPDQPPATRWGRFKRWTGFEGKTAWDLLELLVVPLALAGVGIWFTAQQDARQQQTEEQRAQDTALQAYLDQMSSLMIGDEPLLASEEGSEVRTLARARTATVVQRLDAERNQDVMRFLSEAGLTGNEPRSEDKPPPFSLLSGNDLRGAALMEVDLSGADLSGAFLRGAVLREADLTEAVLRDADLTEAVLRDADLSGAIGVTRKRLEEQTSLLEGAIMPDGSKHP